MDGHEIVVGLSARTNDWLSLREASPRDLWLHAAGVPGSHVIIRQRDDDIPQPVVRRAAELAAFHSKARKAGGKVEVHVCRAADVSKPRGSPAGTVRLRRFDSLKVYPRGADE
jgi:predicted ribosome quality control (RQC) complex YloA/Tae2 family protein